MDLKRMKQMFETDTIPLVFLFRFDGGFIIPTYQRSYSWDDENIDQLLEDIGGGVANLLDEDSGPEEIRFLGTIIKIPASRPDTADRSAWPKVADSIIDGQQRISTLALLAALIYQRLTILLERLPSADGFEDFKQEIKRTRLEQLLRVFSFDLGYGSPTRKPIVIRQMEDAWTYDGTDVEHYRTDVSRYLALVLRAVDGDPVEFPQMSGDSRVSRNLKQMDAYLGSVVERAHRENRIDEEAEFPSAWEIVGAIDQSDIWERERPDLFELVVNQNDQSSERDILCAIVQLLAFAHYLLDRCAITVIDAGEEKWAFDMFQSLNATGTPLTAIETFKPDVNRTIDNYADSNARRNFDRIDYLFAEVKTAAEKTKLTGELLTTFALVYSAYPKLQKQFSKQWGWLRKSFDKCSSIEEKEEFVKRLADHATYYGALREFAPERRTVLPYLDASDSDETELATLCVQYLQDARHRMANAVLSRFFAYILRREEGAVEEFIAASKAIAAFYTLWRSTYSNSGLDDVYRQLLKGTDEVAMMAWQGRREDFTANNLKAYFRRILGARKSVSTKTEWLARAKANLRYDRAGPYVCRFALFLTAQDTVPDKDFPGLMKRGRKDIVARYLTTRMWKSKDLKSIEHIAPQSRSPGWDARLYEDDNFQQVGNLTLLPTEINVSAGNRSWKQKWIHYRHLAEQDPDKVSELARMAEKHGIELNTKTLGLLQAAEYQQHTRPLIEGIGINGDWNLEVVNQRTERICELLWKELDTWLS